MGIIELCVLNFAMREDVYGYEIVKALGSIFDVKESTIYPILKRLSNDGHLTTYLVESSSGPARKYYHVTEQGIVHYGENYMQWVEFNKVVSDFLS